MSIFFNGKTPENLYLLHLNSSHKRISKEHSFLRDQIEKIGKIDPQKASLLSKKIIFCNGNHETIKELKREGLSVEHLAFPKLLGGMHQEEQFELPQPGHGVAYIVLRKDEKISKFELRLTDGVENTVRFYLDKDNISLRYQDFTWNSKGAFEEEFSKQAMSYLCIEQDKLNSDQRFWVAIDNSRNSIKCGFGEICDATTLHKISVEPTKLKNIKAIKYNGEDFQGNDIPQTKKRLIITGLKKGGPIVVDNGVLSTNVNEIKEVNLPLPVIEVKKEMDAVQNEIEKTYGLDIWDKIQESLDHGLLREIVEEKKKYLQVYGGSVQPNQVYVRVGFGDNYQEGPGHRMVIELWPAGHESPIHQHSSSYSYIKIIKGELVNKNYPILSDCPIGNTTIAENIFREGDKTWLSPDQNQVHKIENHTEKGVISFHGYKYGEEGSQPLDGVFDFIDKEGNKQIGSAVISHWDVFAQSRNYGMGISGFLDVISANKTITNTTKVIINSYPEVSVGLTLCAQAKNRGDNIAAALAQQFSLLPKYLRAGLRKMYGEDIENNLEALSKDLTQKESKTLDVKKPIDIPSERIPNTGTGLKCGYYALAAGLLQQSTQNLHTILEKIGFQGVFTGDIQQDQYSLGDHLFRYSIQHADIVTGAVQSFVNTMITEFNEQHAINIEGIYDINDLNTTIEQIQNDIGENVNIYADRIQILSHHLGVNCYINGKSYGNEPLTQGCRIDIYNPSLGHYEALQINY